ncbi:MAG TPA: amidohydrolase family protein [Pyrinomonadaceae bacterium]
MEFYKKLLFNIALACSCCLIFAATGRAQEEATPFESGKFRLHKFQQQIGEENYEITRTGESLLVKSNFKFTDRGTPVPLAATLKTKPDFTPENFEIKGSTSRASKIDVRVSIGGATATIREGSETRQAPVPDRFFAIAGYAPVAVQQTMMRYLAVNKIKGELPTLPGGKVSVEKRGTDRIKVGDRTVALDRYLVSGLIWGREAVWLDRENNLVALVGIDAEFDHFEAIRDGFETALATFVEKAAADNMAALAELSDRLSPRQKGALVIKNANLIDVTGAAPLENAAIVIENGRIAQIGAAGSVKTPKGARVFDARGKYALPGLWDMHAHFQQVEWGPVYLAAGVTTVRDAANEFEYIAAVRDAVRKGRGLGPRLLLAGVIDGEHPSAIGVMRADTPDKARALVNRYFQAGFDQIKIYSSVKPEILRVITAEAHRLGLTVTGHVPRGMNAVEAVESGIDQINHVRFLPPVLFAKDFKPTPGVQPTVDVDSPEARAAIEFFKKHNTVFDPTLAIYELFFHPASKPFSEFEPGAAKLPRELYAPLNNTGVPPEGEKQAEENLNLFLNIVGTLHKQGLTIVAGTDQVVPGHSLHRELELYVKAGLTPMEALQSATVVPARVMKRDKDSGTLETGKVADLVLIEGNPLENVSNIRNTKFVVANGRLFDCAELWQSVGFKP